MCSRSLRRSRLIARRSIGDRALGPESVRKFRYVLIRGSISIHRLHEPHVSQYDRMMIWTGLIGTSSLAVPAGLKGSGRASRLLGTGISKRALISFRSPDSGENGALLADSSASKMMNGASSVVSLFTDCTNHMLANMTE